MSILGDRIKKERENIGLTREDLAKKIGVSYSAIAMYEQGNREPNNELILKMCDLFNCSTDYLMGNSNLKLNSIVDIPQLLDTYQNYSNQSYMPKIEYDILTEDEKHILQDMFCNFAKQVNGNNDYVSSSYFKSKVKDERHWRTMYGIYFVYTKYVYDIFSELNSEFSNNYKQNTGFEFKDNFNNTTHLSKIPILGTVKARYNWLAEENVIGYITDKDTIKDYEKNINEYYALKVIGDSMLPLLSEGDLVIVHDQDDVDSGQTAIVLINGEEATIKKVIKTNEGIELHSMNPYYPIKKFTFDDMKKIPIKIIGRVKEAKIKGAFE